MAPEGGTGKENDRGKMSRRQAAHDGTFSSVAEFRQLRPPQRKELAMDKDRIEGSAKEAKGAVKQAIGKAVGDAKLESDGKADKMEGKVQNAIGGLKDAVKGKWPSP